MVVSATTLSAEAYKVLRSAILAGRLTPGEKLVVRLLSEKLGLSATPIKMALTTLAREGLVTAIPHRGYCIPQFSEKDVLEIFALREVIEGLAARLAAEEPDVRLIQQLKRIMADHRKSIQMDDYELYGDADMAFHQAIHKASGNSRLIITAETFDGQIRLLMISSSKAPGRIEASPKELQAIVEAIIDKNPTSAEKAMRYHVRQAGIALTSHLKISHKVSE